MPIVHFTSNLKRFYPDLKAIKVEAKSIAQLIEVVDAHFPGLKTYLIDDQNSLRDHVNVFINDDMIRDRSNLLDAIGQNDKIFIMQALSGG